MPRIFAFACLGLIWPAALQLMPALPASHRELAPRGTMMRALLRRQAPPVAGHARASPLMLGNGGPSATPLPSDLLAPPSNAGSDDARLAALGYTQQLDRSLGLASNFALSFSIVSVLTGITGLYTVRALRACACVHTPPLLPPTRCVVSMCPGASRRWVARSGSEKREGLARQGGLRRPRAPTLQLGYANGGPVVVIWGWVGVTCGTMLVAASMAEVGAARAKEARPRGGSRLPCMHHACATGHGRHSSCHASHTRLPPGQCPTPAGACASHRWRRSAAASRPAAAPTSGRMSWHRPAAGRWRPG